MPTSDSLSMLIQVIDDIDLDNFSLSKSKESLFQIGWRAKEISWSVKYARIKTISERVWRALEGLPRFLLSLEKTQTNTQKLEKIISPIVRELKKFETLFQDFLKNTGVAHKSDECMPKLLEQVEDSRSMFYLETLTRQIAHFQSCKFNSDNIFHVFALLRLLEQIGEYLKWLSPKLRIHFRELSAKLAKLRDLSIHKKHRVKKVLGNKTLISAVLKDLEVLEGSFKNVLIDLEKNRTVQMKNSSAVHGIEALFDIYADSKSLSFDEFMRLIRLTLSEEQKKLLSHLLPEDVTEYEKVHFKSYKETAGFQDDKACIKWLGCSEKKFKQLPSRLGAIKKDLCEKGALSQRGESFLRSSIAMLLGMQGSQKQLCDLLTHDTSLDQREDLEHVLRDLNISNADLDAVLNGHGSNNYYQRSIWRYVKFKDQLATKSDVELILDQLSQLAVLVCDMLGDEESDPFKIDQIIENEFLCFLSAQKLFEDLDEIITNKKFRSQEDFFNAVHRSLNIQQFLLLTQFRNLISHRPEEIKPSQLIWFFKKWVGYATTELEKFSGSSKSKIKDGIKLIEATKDKVSTQISSLRDFIEVADLVRDLVVSFGCDSKIMVRGTMIGDPIGTQKDVDLIVVPQSDNLTDDQLYELESVLSELLDLKVGVTTEVSLRSKIGSQYSADHCERILATAKDLRKLQLHYDKKSALKNGWFELSLKGEGGRVQYGDVKDKVWADEEIDDIQTIVQYTSDDRLNEERAKREALLSRQPVDDLLKEKAAIFSKALIEMVQSINQEDRELLLKLQKKAHRLYISLDQCFKENRRQIFERNSSLSKFHFRHAFIQNKNGARACVNEFELALESNGYQQALQTNFSPVLRQHRARNGLFGVVYIDQTEQSRRVNLEARYNRLTLFFDQVVDQDVINYFVDEMNDPDLLATYIYQHFKTRFVDPLEAEIQFITIDKTVYIMQSLFQEVMQAVDKDQDPDFILFDGINLLCRAKIQYLLRGRSEAGERHICTIESFANFNESTYEGTSGCVNSDLREYSYPEVTNLSQLLEKHGLDEADYPKFEEDNRRFTQYMEVFNLVNAMRRTEKERIRLEITLSNAQYYLQQSDDQQSTPTTKITDIIHRQQTMMRLEVLANAQKQLLISLLSSNFVKRQYDSYYDKERFLENVVREIVTDIPQLIAKAVLKDPELNKEFLERLKSDRFKEYLVVCDSEDLKVEPNSSEKLVI